MGVSGRVALAAAVPRVPTASARWGLSPGTRLCAGHGSCLSAGTFPGLWEQWHPLLFEPGPGVPLPCRRCLGAFLHPNKGRVGDGQDQSIHP